MQRVRATQVPLHVGSKLIVLAVALAERVKARSVALSLALTIAERSRQNYARRIAADQGSNPTLKNPQQQGFDWHALDTRIMQILDDVAATLGEETGKADAKLYSQIKDLSIELVAMINSESQHVHGQLDLLRKDLFDILKRGAIDGDDVLRGNVSFNKGTRDACNKLGGAGNTKLALLMEDLAALDGSIHDAERLEHAELRAHEADRRQMPRDIASR
jgi:hypothetical protein